jgi:hypothetical protein
MSYHAGNRGELEGEERIERRRRMKRQPKKEQESEE